MALHANSWLNRMAIYIDIYIYISRTHYQPSIGPNLPTRDYNYEPYGERPRESIS